MKHWHLLICFGEWVIWRDYPSKQKALAGKQYWEGRMDWEFKVMEA